MAERKSFLLRLDAEDFEALRHWAEDEFRSLNGQIEFVLRQALMRQRGFRTSSKNHAPARPDRQDR
jgi:hypothetical protein